MLIKEYTGFLEEPKKKTAKKVKNAPKKTESKETPKKEKAENGESNHKKTEN